MRRVLAVLAVAAILAVSTASELRAGAFGLVQPSKTSGPAISATIVTVVDGSTNKGLTSIRVQKGTTTHAVLFNSGYVAGFASGIGNCVKSGFANVVTSTDDRFVGFMDFWVPPAERAQLVGTWIDPNKAAITDIDAARCDVVNGQEVLSFTALIQSGTL